MLIAMTSGSQSSRADLRSALLMPPKNLRQFTLGYKEIVADLLWLRVIQDFDYCESKKVLSNSPKQGEAKEQPVATDSKPCQSQSGWVYRMVDAVTELADNFRMAYVSGAIMLSTVVQDYQGAGLIFDKGIGHYPDDWHLPYYASFNALYNQSKDEKAAEYMLRAAKNGAPGWTYSLAAKLYTKAGKALLARTVLREVLESQSETDRWYPALKSRLDAVESELKNSPPSDSDKK